MLVLQLSSKHRGCLLVCWATALHVCLSSAMMDIWFCFSAQFHLLPKQDVSRNEVF